MYVLYIWSCYMVVVIRKTHLTHLFIVIVSAYFIFAILMFVLFVVQSPVEEVRGLVCDIIFITYIRWHMSWLCVLYIFIYRICLEPDVLYISVCTVHVYNLYVRYLVVHVLYTIRFLPVLSHVYIHTHIHTHTYVFISMKIFVVLWYGLYSFYRMESYSVLFILYNVTCYTFLYH